MTYETNRFLFRFVEMTLHKTPIIIPKALRYTSANRP